MGGAGSDTIVVNLNNTVDGGTENDTFLLRTAGNASLVGGTGVDEIRIEGELLNAANDAAKRSFSLGARTPGIENLTYTGAGAFSLGGNSLSNTITAGAGGNSLSGGLGTDSLVGGLGNDTLDGGAGNDIMSGGAGNDLYIVDSSLDIVAESVGGGARDEISTSFQNFSLRAADVNVEVLSYQGNVAAGAAGFTATGIAGDQTLVGTAGNDVFDGGGGTGDAVYLGYSLSGAAADLLTSTTSTYTSDFDLLSSRPVYLFKGNFNLGPNDLRINSTKTDFTFTMSGWGSDKLSQVKYAIFNNAVIQLERGISQYGDQGFDNQGNRLPLATSGLGNVTMADTMMGTVLSDNLYGGKDNDVYVFDNNNNSAIEAENEGTFDTVRLTQAWSTDYVAAVKAVNPSASLFSFSIGTAAGKGENYGGSAPAFAISGSGANAYTQVENLVYEGDQAFSLAGNLAANSIVGGSGNDTLFGAAGADTLDGGGGSNSLIGGDGNDIFIINSLSDRVSEAATTTGVLTAGVADEIWLAGTAGGAFTLGGTNYANVEHARIQNASGVALTSGAFTVAGDGGGNSIIGGGVRSSASLDGGAGNNSLVSRGGGDTLGGGVGNDLYVISNPNPDAANNGGVVILGEGAGAGGGNDTINTTLSRFDLGLAAGGADLVNIEVLRYTGAGTFTGLGNDFANTILGTSASRVSLIGGAGQDSLAGGVGADTLDGATAETLTGSGVSLADTLSGGGGNDRYIVNTTADAIVDELRQFPRGRGGHHPDPGRRPSCGHGRDRRGRPSR